MVRVSAEEAGASTTRTTAASRGCACQKTTSRWPTLVRVRARARARARVRVPETTSRWPTLEGGREAE